MLKNSKLLNQLNEQQKLAVLQKCRPLLILAGAGTGKTRVITIKIAYLLLRENIPAESILAVTFTNKAAEEMRNRLLSLTEKASNVMIRTFHSFGAWLLRRFAGYLNLNPHFTIYDDADMLMLLKKIGQEEENTIISRENLKRYCKLIKKAKEKGLLPEDNLNSVALDHDFAEVYENYQVRLNKIGNVDLPDLILLSTILLKKNPEIKRKVQKQFQYILVDEYQDSNLAQFKMLKELYGDESYICVVGDEDQSIYGFRGAEIDNILSFPDHFANTEIIRLEKNYRSSKNILSAANAVIACNHNRIGKNLWTSNVQGPKIKIAYLPNETEEAKYCANILSDSQFSNTAILYRNNYQSRSFETLFMKHNIPYRIIGTVRFYEREEIKDALSYLSLLLNNHDIVSFSRCINKPGRGIGKKSLEIITSSITGDILGSLRHSLDKLSKKAREGLQLFISLMKDAQGMLEHSPLSLVVNFIIHESGLFDYYYGKDENDGTTKTKNLGELVNATISYPKGVEGLTAFFETLALNSTDNNPFLDEGRVNLITVHNTKGLEFDRVIVTGLEDGLFPSINEKDTIPENKIEEERRLFYVAMTRAQKHLYLTSCYKRRLYGQLMDCTPSRFIKEIPTAYIDIDSRTCFNPSGKYNQYYSGCGVYHNNYGPGIIQKKWHDGEDVCVTVAFQSGFKASFILQYSQLERISLDDDDIR